ncbi:CarD family transcriptional regulator [Clostridium pasteurianum]|uniref:CarD-like transcriptional regulator n=1 Tax=Clostridium pasteurianum BC1 TaxID=86416 RepID=R4K7T1_CLOPA|nr:CarD family transcriptional regulator [Clostridium pasteurianum]AGK99247.1 CarD-like transcriptional regulator [Clostridium pasteurianum BC1]
MLKVGETIFIPKYGAGIVTSIEDRELYGKVYNYIVITFIINDMKFYIPKERINIYNIRHISGKDEINAALKIIEEDIDEINNDWSKRYRGNRRKINTGNILKIAEVIRDLYYMKDKEIMPPGEEKILEEAANMIVSEIMLVFNLEIDTAYELIRKS